MANYDRLVSDKAEFDSQMELMINAIIAAVIFSATAYAPDSVLSESTKKLISSRRVNGDGFDSWGLPVSKFTLACGLGYHGYIFVFETKIPESQVRYCTDSVEYGLNNGRIDIAITEGSNDDRVKAAFAFGRKRLSARLISANAFLRCRDIEIPRRRVDMHKVVIAELFKDTKNCI